MQKHIIVEGCDGAGKDTFIDRLKATKYGKNFHMHPRASDSLTGPVSNLAEWVSEDNFHLIDLASYEVPAVRYIYNRHPLISERIYGPHRLPDKPTHSGFLDELWLHHEIRTTAAHTVLLLIHPPLYVIEGVLKDQKKGSHMPGVLENIDKIHQDYSNLDWPGTTIRYDRTTDNMVNLMMKLKTALGDTDDDN
jgi:hypothetical protein